MRLRPVVARHAGTALARVARPGGALARAGRQRPALGGRALSTRPAVQAESWLPDGSHSTLGLAAAVGAAAIGATTAVRTVPAGHVGVLDLFGIAREDTLAPGLHVKNPLAALRLFSLKTHRIDYTCSVPSKEGLNVELSLTVQFRLDPAKVLELYKTVGTDFAEVIIAPQVRAAVRSATASRDAKALYTSEREQIRYDLIETLNATLAGRGIVVEDVPMRAIVLPAKLTESIERKLQMEQESQRMDFVLQKEQQEAKRKSIEAQGIADFQRIVSNGIDDKLLRWKGIEATVELAKSDNAKVVVVGSAGTQGMPLILGNGACVGAAASGGPHCYAGAGGNTTHTHYDPAENLMLVARGSKTLQLFAPGDAPRLYPGPNPNYHSSCVAAFAAPSEAADGQGEYARAQPVEVQLAQGDMLYLPAFYYHGVRGGDGFNVLLAWWAAIHPSKRDEAESHAFVPERPEYPARFLEGSD